MSKKTEKTAPGKYDSYGAKKARKDKPKSFFATLKRFTLFMKPQWVELTVVSLCGVVGSLMYAVGPGMIGNVVDVIQQQVDIKIAGGSPELFSIVKELLVILSVYAVYALMTFIQWFIMAGTTQKIVNSLRKKINDKLSRLPLRFFDSNPRGDIMSRVVNDSSNINQHLQMNLLNTISSVVTFVGMLVAMFVVSWKMTLVTLGVIPLSIFIASFFAKLSKGYFRSQWKKTGELNGHIEEMLAGHQVVRAFGYEKKAQEEFDEINEELFVSGSKAQWISGIIMPLFNFTNNIGYILVCIVGCTMVLKGTVSIGTVLTFVAYSKLFTQPLSNMGGIINNIQSTLASAERIFNILDEKEEDQEEAAEPEKNVQGLVEFNNVKFSYYDDRPLIDGLNISVEPGKLVAIVGHTGAGKTTLVNLLMRFYEVKGGSITVDGKDIRNITRENVRKIFGMVLQDTWLFKGTVKENIAYGKEGATDEEIFNAAKSACVSDFIELLPNGYDTVIDESGENISQGQKQLITIARTILSDPSVLILDEATSSVDTRTEKTVQEAMNSLMKNRTSFVIAHRLSTIRDADTILVMDNGSIVENGTHEELMAKNGIYHELYMTQYASVEG